MLWRPSPALPGRAGDDVTAAGSAPETRDPAACLGRAAPIFTSRCGEQQRRARSRAVAIDGAAVATCGVAPTPAA